MEPTATTAGGYFLAKVAAAFAGLIGGLSISFFYQPKKLHQHGKLAAGAIIGSIAVASAFALGGIVAHLLGVNFQNLDIALGIGWVIGIVSVGLVAWVANFLEKRETHDILEVASEVKAAVRGTPKPAAKKTTKPATKRANRG
jgi:hypothetical protein